MLRAFTYAVVIGMISVSTPSFAGGGGSDDGNKLWEERIKKSKEAGQAPTNLFDLLFGDNKKKVKPTK